MTDSFRDTPDVIIFPPLIPLSVLVVGVVLNFFMPLGLLAHVLFLGRTHAQSSQKQPQAAPRKRGGTPKAQKLPKPLRNPKNHPELLAGEAQLATEQGSKTTRSKTLHKHPEAAPGDS
jgi:hypothetical protein